MLTPQAIKDQEFQVKFRGYDSIEVKAYLELLAEDFFELTEQNRVQAEELEAFAEGYESSDLEKEDLVAELKNSHEKHEEKDGGISDLRAELAKLVDKTGSLEQENETYREQVAELEEKIEAEQEIRILLELVEEENRELKKDGVDFKTTIIAAQKFSDNMRQVSEEDAKKLMDDARADVEKYRNEMSAELADLPKKIEELKQRKLQVRDELKNLLNSYLEAIDVFSQSDFESDSGSDDDPAKDGKEDDFSELFQSVKVIDGDDIGSDDLDKIGMGIS